MKKRCNVAGTGFSSPGDTNLVILQTADLPGIPSGSDMMPFYKLEIIS